MSLGEDEEIERVAHHPKNENESQVVEIEEIQTFDCQCEIVGRRVINRCRIQHVYYNRRVLGVVVHLLLTKGPIHRIRLSLLFTLSPNSILIYIDYLLQLYVLYMDWHRESLLL